MTMPRAPLVLTALLLVGCSDPVGPGMPMSACMAELSRGADDEHPASVYLAVMEAQRLAPAAEQSVEIPGSLVARYEFVLASLCESDHVALDSAVSLYHTGLGSRPSVRELMMQVDTADPGMRRWAVGERFTGYEEIDSLVRNYGLQPEEWMEWRDVSPLVLFRSDRPLNMAALADRMTRTGRVLLAEQNAVWWNARSLAVIETEDGWDVSLMRGWGDCLAGCIYRHGWRFHVGGDGSTEYVGQDGDPLPPAPLGWND